MSTHLECVKLWGDMSIAPGIPTYAVSGCLYAEQNALVFKSSNSSYHLTIPWEQIKGCDSYWQWGKGLFTNAMELFTVGFFIPKDWTVAVSWYSAEHDMEIRAVFYVGTSGLTYAEDDANKLAKAIWSQRSQRVNSSRRTSAVKYR